MLILKLILLSILIPKSFSQKEKQPHGGVVIKGCSENMQQIFRRIPMPKCDFNKVALQFYWNHTSA